jgi:metal-responsive CopG/Arc/MetJ family transcriptional regulator
MTKRKATRKKPGPPPTGKTPLVSVRLPEQLIATLDNWAGKNDISRSEAVRIILEKALSDPDSGNGR